MRIRSLLFALLGILTPLWSQSLGLFEGQNDIGTLNTPGTASYDATKHIYSVSSGGENTTQTNPPKTTKGSSFCMIAQE